MAVLWGLAIAAVGAYYLLDPFREMLEPVAEWHRAWGWRAAFDQFVWTVAVIAPANSVFFYWVGHDFSLVRARREWPRPFYRRMVLPNLIPNWIVWIPVAIVTFSFPFSLQIHVNGIVCTFWTLMCVQIGRRT